MSFVRKENLNLLSQRSRKSTGVVEDQNPSSNRPHTVWKGLKLKNMNRQVTFLLRNPSQLPHKKK